MKKTIKLSGLLLAAVILFMGCNRAAEEEPAYKNALFDYKTKTTVDMNISDFKPETLPDGNWAYKAIEQFIDVGYYVDEIEFTKTGSTHKITKAVYYLEGSQDAGYAKYSDSEKTSLETNMNQNKGIYENFTKNIVKTLKKNEEGTMFFVYSEGLIHSDSGTDTGFKANYYLMKK